MPTRNTAPVGAPCWVDLMTSDSARSRDFYSQLFGWTAQEAAQEYGGYFTFTRNGVEVAGCMPAQPDAGMPDVWSVYLASEDAQKTVETAQASGGQVYVAPMQVGDLGTMAVLGDPDGAAIGAWQPDQFSGIGVLAEHGAPGWFELHTRQYEQALTFYRDVFGWEAQVVSDVPEFRYSVLVHGEEQLAGIMDASGFLPEGVPSHWSVYFAVDDVDAALRQLADLGGSVLLPAEDTPYGRLASAADPTGARFKLVGPNGSMPPGAAVQS